MTRVEPSLKHNGWLNGGNIYETKETSTLAWGICYLYSKHNLVPNQNKIIDIADGQTSTFFQQHNDFHYGKKHLVFLWQGKNDIYKGT